ncbi:hypothetical protein LTR56_006127 [Elasticomyces elasticus]|nr:hypothetical protein LTR56_006127 [Elasticomyces elasticus]KAK3667611.1 hypothetical protein LTR22_001426 [Elasticomyces elasticus]KAK4928433.1 hypothetical protein LTR49_004840 [Elasticomyces elasticus]KAK5767234.1 hypothetical protein LTS12_002692 [Elasticomyces elasticus]
MAKKDKIPTATKDEQQQPTEQTTPGTQPEFETATKPRLRPVDTTQAQASSSTNNTPSRPDSWYNGGSWRAKASPVAQIARESISVAKGATSEASVESARRPSQSVSKSMRGSRKSVPLLAEATRVHATSGGGDKSRPRFPSEEKLKGVDDGKEVVEPKEETKPAVVEEAPLPPVPDLDAKSIASTDPQPPSGAWFGWWSRPDGYGSDVEKAMGNKRRKLDTDEASSTPLPGSPAATPADAVQKDDVDLPVPDVSLDNPQAKVAGQWEGLRPEMVTANTSSRSWFGLWSSAQNEQAAAEASASKQASDQQEPALAPEVTVTHTPAIVEEPAKPAEPAKSAAKESTEAPKASGWAFWSSDKPTNSSTGADNTQKEVGELAVSDTPSQAKPEAAQFNAEREEQQKPSGGVSRTSSLLRPKRGRVDNVKLSSVDNTPAGSTAATPSISQATTPADTPPREESEAPAAVKRGKLPQSRPNLILPTFRDLYDPLPNPGYVERLTSYLAQTLRLPGSDTSPSPQHVYINPSPPRVKRAIAIGVHGFFPAPLIQKVLGQPTGTSIRFANYAAASIKAWCEEHQPMVKDVEIEKVALEGEGFVADRVTTLWKLLLNWLSHLRQADFIFVAAHSQGVPVAIMLVAKLIQLGCLAPNVKIGICAMAGINLGPFLEYKSRLWGGSASELFEFCDANSKVSKMYAEALDICLRHGVRVTFVGSLDDQLVSLESSLYAPLSHPYVARAVFIDGRVHAPNFLTHLVVFALKLRNLGISDHGLLRELSAPLAGSLVGGEGHSRVYDDAAVYQLATEFTLETADMTPTLSNGAPAPTAASSLLATDASRARAAAAARRASLSGYPTPAQANSIRRGSISASSNLPGIAPIIAQWEAPSNTTATNPYTLPWAVRGLLEEDTVKKDPAMREEVAELVEEFEKWRPTSKVLKDVRWRLEGVRSLL